LVSQAGVYGAQHNVTQSAARSVFVELDRALKSFGPVEFAVGEGQLLVNGKGLGAGALAGKNLYDRMVLYKVGGILLAPPLEMGEFLYFVGLFGTPPLSLAEQGGFEALLKRAAFRSVQVVNVSYQRVTGEAPAPAPDVSKARFFNAEAAAPHAIGHAKPPPPKDSVLDLSAALAGAAPLSSVADEAPEPSAAAKEGEAAATRRKRAQALAAMLRDAAAVLERGVDNDAAPFGAVLDRIRDVLADMTNGSRRGIATLASEVEEDSKTIASIESAARRRGIGLKLTRGELIQRYAELNQEIVQPLTVSSGVIDLLHSGKTGELNESQRDLLKMASDSMDRVNQLVNYLNRVTGLPESLTPDAAVIRDSYGGAGPI
jgi:hypothetical protein